MDDLDFGAPYSLDLSDGPTLIGATSESEQKKQDARGAALPRFTVVAVKGMDEGCDDGKK